MKNYYLKSRVHNQVGLFVNTLGLIFIVLGISQVFYMFLLGRSLWLDESMLTYSFNQRSIFTLTKNVFEWDQSAPIIYLYLSKLLAIAFGNSEFVLRLLSLVSFCFIILLSYLISFRVFNVKYPILCASFSANISYFQRYANEFKPYMFESMVILSIFYLYFKYNQKRTSWKTLALVFPLSILCANPSLFLIAGIISLEILISLFTKNIQRLIHICYILLFVAIVFITYYFYWLQPTATNDFMQRTLTGYFFPLFPKDLNEFKKGTFLIENLLISYFKPIDFIVAILICFSIIKGCYKRNIYIIVFVVFLSFTFFCSYIHKYPLLPRMCIFLIPFCSLLIFYFISTSYTKLILPSLSLMLVLNLLVIQIHEYFIDSFVYKQGNELNFSINYLQNNIKDDESLYVYHWAIPFFKYKLGYNNSRIGNVNHDNIIWSDMPPYKMNPTTNDYRNIKNLNKCYIISNYEIHRTSPTYNGHLFYEFIDKLFEIGFIELIFTKYSTPLYYYVKNISDLKQRVDYRILELNNSYTDCKVTIRLLNVGDSYIGGTEYYDYFLSSRENNNININLNVKSNSIPPLGCKEISFSFVWKDNLNKVCLQLKNEGKYWFDELGVPPLCITRQTH